MVGRAEGSVVAEEHAAIDLGDVVDLLLLILLLLLLEILLDGGPGN